ncbi:hypothetical protein Lepto7375DRAFT_6687 [Leptolyngbya sp. PCC 7375]|nr:hypothetical protein Lepto7375DRAFT_6687 [Leptolyngbya sp. PCC 7375]
MKHASAETIAFLNALLEQIRSLPGLKEKKLGIFYRKSRAFLHFHEDNDKIYADVRLEEPDFQRFPITTEEEQSAFIKTLQTSLNP